LIGKASEQNLSLPEATEFVKAESEAQTFYSNASFSATILMKRRVHFPRNYMAFWVLQASFLESPYSCLSFNFSLFVSLA
jgi:hypothetical protein